MLSNAFALLVLFGATVVSIPPPEVPATSPSFPDGQWNSATKKCRLHCCEQLESVQSAKTEGVLGAGPDNSSALVGKNCHPLSAVMSINAADNCNGTLACCNRSNFDGRPTYECTRFNSST